MARVPENPVLLARFFHSARSENCISCAVVGIEHAYRESGVNYKYDDVIVRTFTDVELAKVLCGEEPVKLAFIRLCEYLERSR